MLLMYSVCMIFAYFTDGIMDTARQLYVSKSWMIEPYFSYKKIKNF